jgi:hypothetical protein
LRAQHHLPIEAIAKGRTQAAPKGSDAKYLPDYRCLVAIADLEK